LERTFNISFKSFEWQDKIKEGWPTKYVKEKYATIYSDSDAQYARIQTFNCLTTIQNESGRTQITFREEKYHNGMVRTNHCEPNKYGFVDCGCKALDNH
jgi:hypothetical protein